MFQLDWGISLFLCPPLSQLTTCLLLYRLFSLTSFIIPLPPLLYAMQSSNFESLSPPLRVFLWIFLVRFSHYTGSIQFFLILRPEKREKTKKEGDIEDSRGEYIGRQKKGGSDVKAANFRRTAASSFFLHFCSCAEFLALFSPRAFFAFSIGFRAHLQPQRLFCSSLFSS